MYKDDLEKTIEWNKWNSLNLQFPNEIVKILLLIGYWTYLDSWNASSFDH